MFCIISIGNSTIAVNAPNEVTMYHDSSVLSNNYNNETFYAGGLGIAYCVQPDKHTVINGKRLYFDGTAMQLLGNWIKWFFFIIKRFQ